MKNTWLENTMIVGVIIYLILTLLSLGGCSVNPTGPLPPVLHADTFEEHIEMMKTPAHTAKWLEQFSRYSIPYTGWIVPDGQDLAWSLAHDFWMNYIKGYSRGKCGSFAAMQAVCARSHGYEAGVIVYYWWTPDGTQVWGHAEAWIKEANGYSTQSNDLYEKEKYQTLEELKAEYIKLHVHKNGYLTFYDAYWENGEVHQYDD
jgi:hypothetical protein